MDIPFSPAFSMSNYPKPQKATKTYAKTGISDFSGSIGLQQNTNEEAWAKSDASNLQVNFN